MILEPPLWATDAWVDETWADGSWSTELVESIEAIEISRERLRVGTVLEELRTCTVIEG